MIIRKNRAGACCRCGKHLGYYYSKFVEKTPPYRIACSWEGCADKNGKPPDGAEQNWYEYSDG